MSTVEKVNYIRHLTAFYAQVEKDDRLHANHVSLYLALFQLWNRHRFPVSFPVSRQDVLRLCRIGSRNTYARCLKDLQDFNYITYKASKQLFAPGMVTIITNILDKQLPPAEGICAPQNEPVTGPELSPGEAQNRTASLLKIESVPGSKMGHFYYKQINNNKRERENRLPPSKKNYKATFENSRCGLNAPGAENENHKIQHPPDLQQLNTFFQRHNYPQQEACKFFYHYQANGWRQGGKVLITDWQAAAHKWILNIHQLQPGSHEHCPRPSNGTGNLHVNENKNYAEPL
ncbi:hypothetical protein [Chitinophaga arvensicola]|uniref:Uncharacterized protein n=1 Tax=Chitinophaga arvensicola TaxID=29529 RepID=A0A1I0S9R7_9BACT|nr:hypothetical protein [Chitinophaga arvensicola]SEW52838.1 hypothetical protein SAMN04488122_5162 [Chitinophaga arvensicola]